MLKIVKFESVIYRIVFEAQLLGTRRCLDSAVQTLKDRANRAHVIDVTNSSVALHSSSSLIVTILLSSSCCYVITHADYVGLRE